MATTVDQAFREFRSNLEITDRQTALVTTRRTNVVATLAKELTLHDASPSLLIGSYDRQTLTRNLSEGDVDVMVVLNFGKYSDWDNAAGTVKALDRFKEILDAAYPLTTKRRDRNCIVMQFSEFRLDVVPAFRYTEGYYKIPDTHQRQWLQTDPIEFAKKISAVNAQMDGSFVPLIKMVKAWNRAHGWPIASFHLECLMYNRYQGYTKGYTYPSMLKLFFEELAGKLTLPVFEPTRFERVDTYMDLGAPTRRQRAIDKAQAAAAESAEALDDGEKYPSIAIKEWKALLGDFHPAYG